MLPCRGCYIYGTWRSKKIGVFESYHTEERGKTTSKRGTLWGAMKNLPKELNTELFYLEVLTISASCGVKRYMHYIRFLLNKIS